MLPALKPPGFEVSIQIRFQRHSVIVFLIASAEQQGEIALARGL